MLGGAPSSTSFHICSSGLSFSLIRISIFIGFYILGFRYHYLFFSFIVVVAVVLAPAVCLFGPGATCSSM